jgi:hypothetical protein
VSKRRRWWCGGVLAAGLLGVVAWWLWRPDPGDARLRAFVHGRPPVPIVFTSRSEPASLVAAAPPGEGFVYPGRRLWQAREGRLRLLTPRGTVHELTWDRPLPDGGTLIDVMSPSVSPDGSRIVFAGRRGDDHGHFRLYEVGLDGRGLRPLTGVASDPGCVALPPMRFAADGHTVLADADRRRVDYDDVDPIFLNAATGRIVFVSSRTPDLGRGHARRSTTLWMMRADGSDLRPLTANRYNDRWPFLLTRNNIAFSLWSHNQEVVTADESDLRPYEPGMASATQPVDSWLGAFVQAAGTHFGALVKPSVPVWRPRPLFNGRLVFMTAFDDSSRMQVVQAEPGLLGRAPSALAAGTALPRQKGTGLFRGPATDTSGRPLSFATPSPCPDHHVVFAAATLDPGQAAPQPDRYGIWLAEDNWETDTGAPVAADRVGLRLLFDDPDLVDAEPVAVYPRTFPDVDKVTTPAGTTQAPGGLRLADGTTYDGPVGTLFNSSLYFAPVADAPGQYTDLGQGPIFAPPPQTLHRLRIYASRRDRFDDPVRPRVAGAWELLVELPVTGASVGGQVPAGIPTVLAGFTEAGKVLRWTTAPRDSQGQQATFYAVAGDHYSALRPGGQHFCLGCHPGHSGLARADHQHAEKTP